MRNIIGKHLSDLYCFEEILATLLIRIDGTILFSKLPKRANILLFNSIEWIQNTTRIMANELQIGNLKKLIVELKFFNTVFHAAGVNTVLVVVTKSRINLGLLLIEISRRARIIAEIDRQF